MNNYHKLADFISTVVLEEFIEIVQIDKRLRFQLIKLQDQLHIGSNTHDPLLIDSLKAPDIIKLIQIFTLIDQVESRGSVSCVPHLINFYRSMPEITEVEYEAILDWVLHVNNDRNPWLATGRGIYGVRSLDELRLYELNKSFRKIAKSISVEHLMEEQQQEKREKLRLKANQDIWNAIRRKDKKAIEVFIQRGADLQQLNEKGESVQELLEKASLN